MSWLRHVVQDSRFALRTLGRSPGFTATVVLTLALGIGLTSAIFSVFNAVLLRPLAYPAPERLVSLGMVDPEFPAGAGAVLDPDFLDWQANASSFEHLVAYDLSDDAVVVSGEASRDRVAMVSESFWEMSGVRPSHGRLPAVGERDTLVVSTAFFERRLGGDGARLGQAVAVDGRPHTVVGVLPRGFPLQLPWPGWPGFEPREVEAYRTVRIEAAADTIGEHGQPAMMMQLLNVVGRLQPGIAIEQARAELDVLRARAAQSRPHYPGNRLTLRVVPLASELSAPSRFALGVLLASVACVLLIACANVASLLFARASARQKEMAIRAAVGAGRGRLAGQLLLESLLLALAGGAAGLLVAQWGVSLILARLPLAIPRLEETSVDGTVVAFTVGAAVATALLFGLGPSLALAGTRASTALTEGPTAERRPLRPRSGRVLVAIEMALAITLLTGAGLLLKSFWRLTAPPPGFEPQQVLTFKVQFSGDRYSEEAQGRAYIDELLRRTASLPGVRAAGISTHGDIRSAAIVEGAQALSPEEMMQRAGVLVTTVSAGTSRALGMRVVRGRWFLDPERPDSIVINESLARRDFAGVDPVGRRLRLHDEREPWGTIVGVVADLEYSTLGAVAEPEVFLPYTSLAPGRFTAFVRTTLDPNGLVTSVRREAFRIDPTQPVFDVQTLEQALADSIAPSRLNLFLLTAFAAAAAGLALVGTYAVTAFAAGRRTREIGIRMALGATRTDVLAMVMRQTMGPAAAGIGLGLVAAAFLTPVVASLLYEVEPTDPATFAVAGAGLLLIAAAAALLPAWRAARTDPAQALR